MTEYSRFSKTGARNTECPVMLQNQETDLLDLITNKAVGYNMNSLTFRGLITHHSFSFPADSNAGILIEKVIKDIQAFLGENELMN